MTLGQRYSVAWTWYKQTSCLLGMPVVLILLLIGAQKLFFTTGCYTVGYGCQYAYGSEIAGAVQHLIDASGGGDVIIQPGKSKR